MSQSTLSPEVAAKAKAARDRLDAHTYETVQWHFHPSTGCPFWLEYAKSDAEVRSAQGNQDLRRPEEVPGVRRRVAPRRPGPALGAAEVGGQAGLRLRNRRHDRHPEEPRRRTTTGAPTTRTSARRCPTSTSRKGANWLMLGPSRPASAAAGGRASGASPRRHLLLHRSRSALGHQAHQEGLDGTPRRVQEALHRPGAHDPRRRSRHAVHVHHAEAARSLCHGAREARQDAEGRRHHRHLLRRHRVHAAVDPLRHRRIPRRRLHDADLRQHADGPGLLEAGHGGRQATRSATTPRSRGPAPKSSSSTTTTRPSATARRAA